MLFSRDLLPFSLRLSFPKPTSRRKPTSKSKSFIVRSHSFIRSSKFARFSFFFFSLFLATRFSEFSSSNERATLGGGVTKKKTRKGNRLRSSAQHLGSTVWNTARFVRCSAYVRVVESAGCRRGERNKGACPSTTASNPITLPLPLLPHPAPVDRAILFKGASATGEHGKGCTNRLLRRTVCRRSLL